MNLNSYLTLTIDPSTSDSLSFKITKATIKESLEDLFSIECEGYIKSLEEDLFSSTPKNINFQPKILIDNLANFTVNNPYPSKTLNVDKDEIKSYKGILTYVNYLGINQESLNNLTDTNSTIKTLQYKHFFSFKIESVLKRLSLNQSSRIYTNTNILDVIKEILNFYQGLLHKEIDFSSIHLNFEKQELISQYKESDLEFITRLAHNNGIFFYEDANTIYFCNYYAKSAFKSIKYNPNINNILNEACITQVYKEQNLRTNTFIHSSIQAYTPLNTLALNSSKFPYEEKLNKQVNYKEHIYEGAYSFTQNIDLKTLPIAKERRVVTLNESLSAKSNIYHLSLKDFIYINYHSLTNHFTLKDSKDKRTDFVIIANTQILIDDAILANSINTNDYIPLQEASLSKSYSNTLTLLPSHFIFAPSPKVKPKAPSSTQGIVIGEGDDIEKERNTIYTDEYGRVKVRINLFANQEEIDQKDKAYHHSPFLRVSSPIASYHSGFYHTPRVGDEVIISFLDDDIDKPYISASLYNQSNQSLNKLPYNDHQTSLSSRTIGVNEEGYNELSLFNLKDKEQIYLQAQKDYEELIKHNFTQTIQNNKDSQVGGNYNERIKKIHIQTIDLAKNVNVGGEYLTNVALSKDTIVGLSNTLNVGASNKLRVAKDSSEYIGEDKEVEIGGNINTNIEQDENKNIKGNKKEMVEGTLDIQSTKEFNLSTQSQMNFNAKDNILFFGKESTSFETQKELSFIADNTDMESKSNFTNTAGKQILHQVGDSSITAKEDSVIIKAGGIEVVIDSKGLLVKGGEIKAE